MCSPQKEVSMGQQNQGDHDKQQNNPGQANSPNPRPNPGQKPERGSGIQSDRGMGQGQPSQKKHPDSTNLDS
jgi:hypothetical protein